MKAMVINEFGPPEVLQLTEMDKPVPEDNEILMRIHATSAGYGDLTARKFKYMSPREFNMPFLFWVMARLFFGLNKPKITILGSEFSGVVEDTGAEVTKFKKGDQVFGYRSMEMGAYAEYLAMPEDGVVTKKPVNMSHEEAAVIPSGGMTAFNLIDKLNIGEGQRVLVIGASGGIGSIAVQLASAEGAEVTGVCGTPRLEFVKSLGAVKVIDYTREDFTQSGDTYDIIFDVLGRSSYSKCKNSLTESGRYVLASFKMKKVFQMLWKKMFSRRRVLCLLSPQSLEDLVSLRDRIEEGRVRSVIDRAYPLEQAAEAHRYVEEGHRKGPVVITV